MTPGHEQAGFTETDQGRVPEGWQNRPLKSHTTKIGSGATPRGGKESYKASGISLFRSLNVYDFRFEMADLAFIDEEQAAQLDNVVVEKNDILLNITGASVARCCMAPSFLLPARVNQHVAIIRVDPDKADPFFVFNAINSPRYKDQLLAYAQGGATREALTKDTISNFTLTGDSLPGVLAVWVATLKGRGGFVVGWYRDATVYRRMQPAPPGSNRRHGSEDFGYFASARSEDAVLLPDHERVYRVPQATAGGFGKSNVFFANDPAKHQRLRAGLLRYIETRRVPRASEHEAARQPDPLLRQQVEKAAIRETVRHFRCLGYAVGSVERDNVGWDLNAVNAVRQLRLEVKGLSGSDAVVDLTPNEYRAMRQHRDSYRVCVVTNALTDPCLEVFAYSRETSRWESPAGRVLAVEEIVAARCTAS